MVLERLQSGAWTLFAFIVAIAIAIALIAVAIIFIRRKRRSGGKAAKSVAIRANRLVQIYRRFVRKQPREYQRSILGFQPVVVLGDASSKKTDMIHRFCDWQQQTANFLESDTTAEELQIYLGSRVLVHDLSPALVLDSSRSARTALVKLWNKTFRARRPIVVIAVSARMLLRNDIDELEHLATLLRGKVNLLSGIHRQPIETRVVVSDVEELPGFAQLCAFAESNGIETRIESTPEGQLGSFDLHLPRALVHSNASDYMAILAFSHAYPKLAASLQRFLTPLTTARASGRTPLLEGIYLVGHEFGTANPFWLRDEDLQPFEDTVTQRHRMIAIAVISAAVLYQGLGYWFEHAFWSRARDAVDNYVGLDDPTLEKTQRARIKGVIETGVGPLRFFPQLLTPGAKKNLKDDFSNAAAQKVIHAQLEELRRTGATHLGLRALYLQGLLRASGRNKLGVYIKPRLSNWSDVTGLDEQFLADYIEMTNEAGSLTLESELNFEPATQWKPWINFIATVDRALSKRYLSADELATLVRTATDLHAGSNDLVNFVHANDIVERLPSYDRFRREWESSEAPEVVSWVGAGGPLEVLHAIIDEGGVSLEPPANNFKEMSQQLTMIHEQSHSEDSEHVLAPSYKTQRPFTFRSSAWRNLVRRTRTHQRIQSFISATAPNSNLLFDNTPLRAIQPTTSLHFSSRPSLPGRYTAYAFSEVAKPGIAAIVDEISALGEMAATEDQIALNKHLRRSIEAYADEYDQALLAYFREFQANANSVAELRIVLTMMLSDSSYFAEYLDIATDNACLPIPNEDIYASLAAVQAHYAGLCTLSDAAGNDDPQAAGAGSTEAGAAAPAPAPPATNPKLAEYQAILSGLADALGQDSGGEMSSSADGGDATVGALADRLSGAGTVALDGLSSEVGSYNTLISQWAQTLPLDPELQRPFLAPLPGVYRIGGFELATAVGNAWQAIEPMWEELLSSYPFSPDSTVDATPELIDAVLHPQTGLVAVFAADELELVARKERDGAWTIRRTPYGPIPIDTGILEAVHTAQSWSSKLYDGKGEPRSLQVVVRALPLSTSDRVNPVPTLGFLVIGDQKVLAFNHRSTRKRLRIPWHEPVPAQVGVKIVDPDTAEQRVVGTPSVSVAPSAFSLLRLLDLGTSAGRTHTWTVGTSYSVSFHLTSDPRLHFLGGE